MIDYKLLEALRAVCDEGGFERAARQLGLSQSAVSQRIKLLEARVGAPVLRRSTPPSATELGQQLLNHLRQVSLLERDLRARVPGLEAPEQPERLRLVINADSLATWWAAAVGDFCQRHPLLLDLQVEDQDIGLRRLREGDVVACLCSAERPLAGARSLLLGRMRYLAVASPAFLERQFAQGVSAEWIARAPAVVFGPEDRLQQRYLAGLGCEGPQLHHLCPSSEGFVRLIAAGMGWGMVPALQIRERLAKGELQELLPGQFLDVPLYWHYWRNGGELLAQLTDELARKAPALLAGENQAMR